MWMIMFLGLIVGMLITWGVAKLFPGSVLGLSARERINRRLQEMRERRIR
jgi:sensor histidine kinase regulating citrate/malate metabolism